MKFAVRTLAALLVIAFIAGAAFYWNPLWFSDQLIRYHLWRSDVRSEYTQVDGYRIHYFEAVPPHGAPGIPLLLIHGLGSRGEDWSPMIPTLAAKGFHVYAPDLLGYGRSARPNQVESVPVEENIVVGFMQAVHLTHADVDGWSMGGWIAAGLALDHPALVDRLVLDDSAGLTYAPPFDRTAFTPTNQAGLIRLMNLLSPHPPHALPAFAVRATLRKIARNATIVQQSLDSMESGSDILDARLKDITQPTLIVWGTEDRLIPIAVGETMHRDIPDSAFLAIAGCGHLAPGECSKPVLSGTIQFLKSTPPPRSTTQTLPGN
jgi:pimeloyl-ACP methyl ester carboxylesterase